MIKYTKRAAALLFVIMLALSSVIIASAAEGKIIDDAGALSSESVKQLQQALDIVSENTGWDLVVNINRNNVDYDETEKTAYKYAKDNNLENGLLFQIDLGSRELQIIEQGEAMEYFNDTRITDMKSDVVYYMKSDDYDEAIFTFAEHVNRYFYDGKPEHGKFTNIETNEKYNSKITYVIKRFGIIIGLGSVVVALIIVLIVAKKYKHHGKQGTYDLTANSSVDLSVEVDEFVTKHVTSRTIRDDNDSDSGGSGSSRGIGGSSF